MASDDNYAVHLGICIVSIMENNSRNVNMHILDNNISEVNLNRLKSLEDKYSNLKINFYNTHDFFRQNDIDCLIRNQLKDNDFYKLLGIAAFSRLFLQDILPSDIEMVLYLDSDTLVLDNLDELFSSDMDNLVSGVVDVMANITKSLYRGHKKSTPFINSGVLLINLKRWREIDFAGRAIDLIKEYRDKNYLHDQNIINIICGDDISLMSPKFNTMSEFFYVEYSKNLKMNKYFDSINQFYSIDEVDDALKHPVVVHFLSRVWDRPWISQSGIFKHNPKNPFNRCYHYYKSISPWCGEEIEKNTKKIQEKIYYEMIRFIMMYFPVKLVIYLHIIKNRSQ